MIFVNYYRLIMKATKVLINVEGIKGMEEYADNSYYGFSKGMSPDPYRQSYGGNEYWIPLGYEDDGQKLGRTQPFYG